MIEVTICGYDTLHKNPCHFEHNCDMNDYLLLIVRSDAWFMVNDECIKTKPGMLILFDKNSYIHYGKDTLGYNDDWIHFHMSTEDRDNYITPLNSFLNQPFYLHDYYALSHYIQLITNIFYSEHIRKDVTIDALMRALLCNIDNLITQRINPHTAHRHYSVCSKIRTKMYNNPSLPWSASSMAEQLGISTSYFQHLYKQFFGYSCQRDIINARLESAKFYLSSSNMKINVLSHHCGYENEFHFIRQFKKFVGMSPGKFRSIHSTSNQL